MGFTRIFGRIGLASRKSEIAYRAVFISLKESETFLVPHAATDCEDETVRNQGDGTVYVSFDNATVVAVRRYQNSLSVIRECGLKIISQLIILPKFFRTGLKHGGAALSQEIEQLIASRGFSCITFAVDSKCIHRISFCRPGSRGVATDWSINKKRESRTFCPFSRSEALELPIVVERTECRGLTRNMNICQLSALACRL